MRFSEETGGRGVRTHWYIRFDSSFRVDFICSGKTQGVVYFSSSSAARRAIDEIILPFICEHPEFVW